MRLTNPDGVIETVGLYRTGGADCLGVRLTLELLLFALRMGGRKEDLGLRPAARRSDLPRVESLRHCFLPPLPVGTAPTPANVLAPWHGDKGSDRISHSAPSPVPARGPPPTPIRPKTADGRPENATLRSIMDVSTFCMQSHVLIVAGKGGVGKTTMVAAIARMAADAGLSVLVIELEGRSGVSDAFGHGDTIDYAGAVLSAAGANEVEEDLGPESEAPHIPPGSVQARRITPADALIEYLADHGLRRFAKRLMSSGIIDIVSSAIPGIRDILVLGKVKQIEQAGLADLVLVDAPATGHAMTFLSSASGLLDAARGGPVRTQASEVVELLTDPTRCQVALVTLPEEMPVSEVVDAAYQL